MDSGVELDDAQTGLELSGKIISLAKKTKAPSKYIYLKSLLLHFSKNALKSAHFTFLQLEKIHKATY